ncbi:hypothetical protein MSG28_002337 [Choristoneura fumiferana]|uniref:Uncharacterized protein n=1 Tax=Choristoneura fumiferana TaxID=7141 RepID=A0ACC0JV94_CHOFU|nr:hypothetical protein MSG28_002337 [Choristoneura fumiferana]
MSKKKDITDTYKYPERTWEERATMEKALRRSSNIFARYYLNDAFNDVAFDFELRDDIKIGQDFSVILHMKNRSSENKHTVRGVLRVDTVTYTGKTGEDVKRQDFEESLAPEEKRQVAMMVSFNEYYKRLVDQASFNIACLATIVEKNFDYFAQDDFRVRNPDIKISVEGKPVSRKEFTVTVKLENPLPIPLKNGKFYIQGPGLDEQLKISLDQNVQPGEFATAQFQLTPPWAGRHQISAKFSSKEMHDVDGFLSKKLNPSTGWKVLDANVMLAFHASGKAVAKNIGRRLVDQEQSRRVARAAQQSVSSNLMSASPLARNQRFVPAGEGRAVVHSHVNNYRRGSNYKAPLRPADTYSSRVRAARDSFLRARGQPASHHRSSMLNLLRLVETQPKI